MPDLWALPVILESGDHLTRAEFHRLYCARPDIKKAELVEGVVYVGSPRSSWAQTDLVFSQFFRSRRLPAARQSEKQSKRTGEQEPHGEAKAPGGRRGADEERKCSANQVRQVIERQG